MIKPILRLFLILMFMGSTAAVAEAQAKISFNVSFTEPQAHYVDVTMEVKGLSKDQLEVKMPVWAPGSYLVREFAKNVEGFTATDTKGNPLNFRKTNKNTWQIDAGKKDVSIRYRVYAFEISVRTSFVDASHAFLSPTGIFMYVNGQIKQPATVTFEPFKGWNKISTGLEQLKNRNNTYYAADFDILFDSPIEVGNQDVFEFNAAGVRHEVAMYGGGNYNKERLKRDMAKIVEQETAIFGENPNKHYVFIVHNYLSGGGGLEHLNSTVLGATRMSYTNESSYTGFLGLVAHEYFHLWNVKRLRPKALGPFNYDEENYTTNLWISEGFTAYYDNLVVRRAGFTTVEAYLNDIAGSIGTVENQPGNRIQPVSESSFDAWIKQYRPNENSKNNTISYYDKGSLVALVMDLEIRNATNGEKGLDDVMKAMYDEYYKKQGRGFTDAEFKAMVEKFSGKSADDIYRNYVNGTQPIDYAKYLGYAGLTITVSPASKGVYLGTTTSMKDGRLTVTNVARNSSAWTGGINVNDELIAVDGQRITDLDKMMAAQEVGDKVKVLVNRDGLIRELDITLVANPTMRYVIGPMENPTAKQQAVLRGWLKF